MTIKRSKILFVKAFVCSNIFILKRANNEEVCYGVTESVFIGIRTGFNFAKIVIYLK